MTVKEELHRLVDELPESELKSAHRALEYLRERGSDPLLRALLEAPEDEEGETDEERASVREAYEDLSSGRVLSHEEVRKRLLGQS